MVRLVAGLGLIPKIVVPLMDKPGTRKEKVNSMKIGNIVHEKVLLLPDSNVEPMNHKTDVLTTDPAGKHI